MYMVEKHNATDINTHIGKKIREKRKKSSITLEQISKILNVTYQQIQKYENGTSRIPIEKLYDLSLLLDIPIQSFFEGINKGSTHSRILCNNRIIAKKNDKHLNIFIIDNNPVDEFLTRKAIFEVDKNIKVFCVQNDNYIMSCLKRRDTFGGFPIPDIIFMDINISKNGYHLLLSEIKKEKKLQEIPIIILTNSIHAEDLLKVYKFGASSFMCKSLNFETFKNDMKICLEYWSNVVVLPSLVWDDFDENGDCLYDEITEE